MQLFIGMEIMRNNFILLNHGSGGTLTNQLIEEVFRSTFSNEILNQRSDSAVIPIDTKYLAFTTDSFVVSPHFFAGGDIGKLAVCGTVNDLAVSGAKPLFLSAAFILEEGFPIENLQRITNSMAIASAEANVKIVTGDTKVVNHGLADGVYITTTGIGILEEKYINIGTGKLVKEGDVVIVNGTVGDHGMSIFVARNEMPFQVKVESDCAPLNKLIQEILENCGNDVSFMRDATRGGIGTVICELAEMCGKSISLDERNIPIRDAVSSLCEMFGFDPLFIANEGKFIITVRPYAADKVISIMKKNSYGRDCAVIGEIENNNKKIVTLKTSVGGTRIITIPAGDQLPRIC